MIRHSKTRRLPPFGTDDRGLSKALQQLVRRQYAAPGSLYGKQLFPYTEQIDISVHAPMIQPLRSIVHLRRLAVLLSALVAQNCWACHSPPVQQRMHVDEQIMRASDVSVAQVMSATPLEGKLVEYRFVVLRRLAGQHENTFTVTGRAEASRSSTTGFYSTMLTGPEKTGRGDDTSFNNHTDPAFWKRGGGRVMNGGDCRIYPNFVVGGTYLVFLNSPWSWRSFEKIELVNGAINEEDKWLAYVAAGLAMRKKSEVPSSAGAPRNEWVCCVFYSQ